MDIKTICDFSLPVDIGSTTAFSKIDCTTSNPVVLQITDGTSTAYISQSWDFGTLFLAFLLVVWSFYLITKEVFIFIFHRYVAVLKQRKFPMK